MTAEQTSRSRARARVQPQSIAASLGFSAIVGVGPYPAHEASGLDPIQALRLE